MKIFQCKNCNNPIFFENTFCEKCNCSVGYLDTDFEMYFSSDNSIFTVNNQQYVYCNNHKHETCNWLVPYNTTGYLCTSCNLNRTIPNISDTGNLIKWQKIEEAKHRLIYSLQRFNLPIISRVVDAENGLCFDFLNPEDRKPDQPAVRTGHASGVITLNIKEADSVHREFMRNEMQEPYRTLIGHFRHEVGHYYWDQLIWKNKSLLADYRKLFGDETQNYGEALKIYYDNGAPNNWQSYYISEYATSHPWEDWAETWSHYHHLVATLETAFAFGLTLNPKLNMNSTMKMNANFNLYDKNNFDQLIDSSIPLSSAVNSINRSMGQPDLYPFVLNSSVIEKLRFVHQTLHTY